MYEFPTFFLLNTMAPPIPLPVRGLIVGLKANGATIREIEQLTGVQRRQIQRLYQRAIERGFDPEIRPLNIQLEHVQDAPRSGRPTKRTEEAIEAIKTKIQLNRYTREKNYLQIAGDLQELRFNISRVTV